MNIKQIKCNYPVLFDIRHLDTIGEQLSVRVLRSYPPYASATIVGAVQHHNRIVDNAIIVGNWCRPDDVKRGTRWTVMLWMANILTGVYLKEWTQSSLLQKNVQIRNKFNLLIQEKLAKFHLSIHDKHAYLHLIIAEMSQPGYAQIGCSHIDRLLL